MIHKKAMDGLFVTKKKKSGGPQVTPGGGAVVPDQASV